jgi:hypothetical protein
MKDRGVVALKEAAELLCAVEILGLQGRPEVMAGADESGGPLVAADG